MKNNWLTDYKKNVTSQCGEDGIIEKIFEVLKVKNGFCVDVGAYGMSKSNTYSLVANGWSGIMIDFQRVYRLIRIYRNFPNVQIIGKKVDLGENKLDDILSLAVMPWQFDFLSIDIDGNDYWVWESLVRYSPSVVVIEFNPMCGLGEYVQPFDSQGGASLKSLVALGKIKNYELISTTEMNAFFVRKELFSWFDINNNSPEELFTQGEGSYGKDKKNYAKT